MQTTLVVGPSKLEGIFTPPPSKSQTLRAVLFAALANGISTIENALDSPDTEAMIAAAITLGAEIERINGVLKIKGTRGKINIPSSTINAGNSGIVLRFLAALAALNPAPITLTGDDSIQNLRTLSPLLKTLESLGANVRSLNKPGFAPVTIQGPIIGGNAQVVGTDSQFVSALLITLSLAEKPSRLIVKEAGELPWVNLTVHWLKTLGVEIEETNLTAFTLKGGASWEAFHYKVPGDISSASFALGAALATQSTLKIQNINLSDPQGDNALIKHLLAMSAQIDIASDKTSLTVYPSVLKGKSIDINDCIDSLPILSVIGCFAEGQTHLYNAAVARTKESNRIEAITHELKKMGAQIEAMPDGIVVNPSNLQGSSLSSHKDHRIAMSLAVAAMRAKGSTQINDTSCIAKTFPHFSLTFKKLGVNICCMEEAS